MTHSNRVDWGSGYRPRDAFHAHYPTVSAALDEWAVLMAATGAATAALSERMKREAGDVARRSEGRWSLGSDFHVDALRFTLTHARADDLDVEFHIDDDVYWRSYVMRDDDESIEDWEARADRNRARVEALGNASLNWPEALEAGQTFRRMEAYRRDRLPDAAQRLQLILEHGVPLMAKGCPTCEGKPS